MLNGKKIAVAAKIGFGIKNCPSLKSSPDVRGSSVLKCDDELWAFDMNMIQFSIYSSILK